MLRKQRDLCFIYGMDRERQSISHLLSNEKVALNKSSIGRRKQKRWVVGRSLVGEAIQQRKKWSWNKGGAELLTCHEDPALPHSDVLSLPTLTPGVHQRMVSASVFPTSWAVSVTSQPLATSFYPWIIIFTKLSMQSPFLALHPWYVVGFLGGVLVGDPCNAGPGAKAEERSPCLGSSWSGSSAGDTEQGPCLSSVQPVLHRRDCPLTVGDSCWSMVWPAELSLLLLKCGLV